MHVSLTEMAWAIADAVGNLERAADLAYAGSGDEPGRQGDPEHGIPEVPAVPGWGKLLDLHDRLIEITESLKDIIPEEVKEAIQEEQWADGPEG